MNLDYDINDLSKTTEYAHHLMMLVPALFWTERKAIFVRVERFGLITEAG